MSFTTITLVLCQSFAKNMGLYGERVGTLSFLCKDKVKPFQAPKLVTLTNLLHVP